MHGGGGGGGGALCEIYLITSNKNVKFVLTDLKEGKKVSFSIRYSFSVSDTNLHLQCASLQTHAAIQAMSSNRVLQQ